VSTGKRLKHPDQPTYIDNRGTRRFKANAIIEHLLDVRAIDLNALALMNFSNEDRAQLAQLIGYSVQGWYDLNYVSKSRYERVPE
jgi:hypothetical protein